MVDPVIVREWLAKADEDLLFAEANMKDGNEFYAQICFHFQQAAEKYLKTFILARDLPFGKVHDLVSLLKICSQNEPSLLDLKEACITLNAAYIETRYPVHWPTEYTRATAEEGHAAVKVIADKIKEFLCMK